MRAVQPCLVAHQLYEALDTVWSRTTQTHPHPHLHQEY